MNIIEYIKSVGNALKESIFNFGDYKIPKKSASLAYYTTFSLAPITYFLLLSGSFIWGEEIATGALFSKLNNILGFEVAEALQEILKKTSIEGNSLFATIISVITLIFAASGVFAEIQDSINEIWCLKVNNNRKFWSFFKDRLYSFSIIIALGFIFLVSMIFNSVLDIIHDNIALRVNSISIAATFIINYTVTIVLISSLFFLIFTILPDVKFPSYISITGALLTTILFLVGKYIIGIYLTRSDLSSVFGAGGTIVILLSWVYYTSIILYFGASFTKNFALIREVKLNTMEFANFVENKQTKISTKEMKSKNTPNENKK